MSTHTSMKSVIIAALIGSAAAFTPAYTAKPSTQLRASAAALGVQPPVGFFDPFLPNSVSGGGHVHGGDFRSGGLGVDRHDSEETALGLGRPGCVGRTSSFSPAQVFAMKVVSSIGSMKKRSKTLQVVRRRGRVYLIDKKNPRLKVRQGGAKMKKRSKK